MNHRKLTLLAIVAFSLALSGCLHDGGGEAVERFVESEGDVESYSYSSYTLFEIDAGTGTPTQTTEIDRDARVDVAAGELHVETYSTQDAGAESSFSNTSTYLLEDALYERTVSDRGDTGWMAFDVQQELDATWNARHQLPFYRELLEDASVSSAADADDADGSTALDVELDDEERTNLLDRKLGDDVDALAELDVEEFTTTVWIEESTGNLQRVETDVSVTVEDEGETGAQSLNVALEFVDDFHGYGEPLEIDLPPEARDAEPVVER